MATQSNLPTRTNTLASGYTSDDDNIPTGDPSNTLGLLEERLQAWKHMVGYLEDYVKAIAKDQHSQSKDSEKIMKTLNNPLREGHHFDQSLGGVAGLFENLRANTQAQGQLYAETEKNITGNVLPILERLHKEIKAKRKELTSGAGKQNKAVESAKNESQKHIELLGQQTATFDSSGGKVNANNDPYVVQRGVWHRLNKQLLEENNQRSDMINVQNNFHHFETHVITTVQSAFTSFNQLMAGQYDRSKAMYGDMAQTAGAINPDFEWNGFVQRNGHILVSPNAPAQSIDSMTFPNLGHRATRPLIEGSLERKSRGMGGLGGYKTYYYAVTPAGYMHEYKDNDNLHHDPEPETSLYLPECNTGAVDGQKFTIKGKDVSGGKLSQKMSMSSEYQFKAHTAADAQQWHSIIFSSISGGAAAAGASAVSPVSPVSPQSAQGGLPPVNTAAAAHTQPTTATPTSAHPTSAAPMSGHPTSAHPFQHEQQTGIAQTTSPTATTTSPIAPQTQTTGTTALGQETHKTY